MDKSIAFTQKKVSYQMIGTFSYGFESYLGNVSIQLNTSSGTRPALREVM